MSVLVDTLIDGLKNHARTVSRSADENAEWQQKLDLLKGTIHQSMIEKPVDLSANTRATPPAPKLTANTRALPPAPKLSANTRALGQGAAPVKRPRNDSVPTWLLYFTAAEQRKTLNEVENADLTSAYMHLFKDAHNKSFKKWFPAYSVVRPLCADDLQAAVSGYKDGTGCARKNCNWAHLYDDHCRNHLEQKCTYGSRCFNRHWTPDERDKSFSTITKKGKKGLVEWLKLWGMIDEPEGTETAAETPKDIADQLAAADDDEE